MEAEAQRILSELEENVPKESNNDSFDGTKQIAKYDGTAPSETEINEPKPKEAGIEEEPNKPLSIPCTLDEEAESPEKEKETLDVSASWRNESINDEFDEDEEDYSDEEDEDYDVDEEAAEEWLNRYYLRQKGLPAALACLPSSIKISVVPETEEDKLRREEKQREELGN